MFDLPFVFKLNKPLRFMARFLSLGSSVRCAGLECRVEGVGLQVRVWDVWSGFMVKVSCMIQGFRVQGFGFRVQGV